MLHTRVVTGSGGGPDKTILNSPRFLADEYDMVCAYMRPNGYPGFAELTRRGEAKGATVLGIDDDGALDIGVIRRFRDLCRSIKPDIWHGHDYKSNLLGLLLRRHHPMHLITTVHGWVTRDWKLPIYYAVDRACLKRYDRVVAVSPDLHAASIKAGVKPERCTYLPNGVDTEDFRRRTAIEDAKAAQFGAPRERIVFGAAGRLSGEKGFHFLIRAFAAVRKEIDALLWIAGEGPQRAELLALIRELGLESSVKLLGFQSDVRPLYEGTDVFMLSSLREGIPNVVLEAMAYGLPIVSTPIAGLSELIEDGKTGRLVTAGEVAPLSNAMLELARAPETRQAFGAHARTCVETRFSFRNRMEGMRQVYHSLR